MLIPRCCALRATRPKRQEGRGGGRTPPQVEFLAWLPNAGESPLLRDVAYQFVGLLEPFAVVFVKAAFEFGEHRFLG